ncbi:hypothetical protein ACTMTI_42935 [Nonomuraea sp. H19]
MAEHDGLDPAAKQHVLALRMAKVVGALLMGVANNSSTGHR